MFATQTYFSTCTNCTAPRAKSFFARPRCQARYASSGPFQRAESARTNPFPQPPRSLQTWQMIFTPAPCGDVASPLT